MKLIRCSQLDRLIQCPESVLNTKGLLRNGSSGPEAAIGKAVHAALALMIEGKEVDLQKLADAEGLTSGEEHDDVLRLYDYGCKVWDANKHYFPMPQTERSLGWDLLANVKLVGTADVISPVNSTAIIGDWKTGREEDYYNQMAGLAYLTWCTLGRPENEEVTTVIFFLRLRYVKIDRFDAATLKAWEHNLLYNKLAQPAFSVGRGCRYCELRHSCTALQTVITSSLHAVALPASMPEDDPYRKAIEETISRLNSMTIANKGDPMTRRFISDMRFKLKLAQTAIDDATAVIRLVAERVGGLPTADGTVLEVRAVNSQKLLAEKSLKVLRETLSDPAICGAMTISWPKIRAACLQSGKRDTKGPELLAELTDKLTQAGAFRNVTIERLDEVPEIVNGSNPIIVPPCAGVAGEGGGAGAGDGEPIPS